MPHFNDKFQQNTPTIQDFEVQAEGLTQSMTPPPFQLAANPIQTKTEEGQNDTGNETSSGQISLSGSVGIKGKNYVKDVKAIQHKLKEMGFFSEDGMCNENQILLSKLKDDDTIEWKKIPRTIGAIKEYERIVEYRFGTPTSYKNLQPTGKISKSGYSIQLMNGQIPKPSQERLSEIQANRKALSTQVVEGGPLSLSGPVGNTSSGNKKADVIAIQQRLLGLLPKDRRDKTKKELIKLIPAESPEKIRTKYPDKYDECMDQISPEHIPNTIKAIQSFQSSGRFQHSYWQNKKFKGVDLSDYTYTDGIISTGDLSDFIISNYRKYKFSFKDDKGNDKTIKADNFPKSWATKEGAGISTIGSANPSSFSVEEFKAFGITDVEAQALLFVSKNEGKFNAVNTYDRAKVSLGFVQFAGGSGGGSLPTMLANLKQDSPSVFKSKFQDYGIDVEYVASDEKIKKATVVAIDPSQGGEILRGQEAEEYIQFAPELIPAFLDAGHDKEVQKAQVKTSVTQYVIPSRSKTFTSHSATSYLKYKKEETAKGKKVKKDVTLMGHEAVKFSKTKEYEALPEADKGALTKISLSGEKLSEYLSSEKSRAVIIDQCINKGLGGGPIALSKGVRDYMIAEKITSKTTLKSKPEVDILDVIKKYAADAGRVEKAINDANLSGT